MSEEFITTSVIGSMKACDVVYRMRAAHLSGAVAALAAQVLPVDQKAAGSSALQRQTRVDEGRGPAVMIHEERLRVKHDIDVRLLKECFGLLHLISK